MKPTWQRQQTWQQSSTTNTSHQQPPPQPWSPELTSFFEPGKKSESHRESCAGGFEVMIHDDSGEKTRSGISMYRLGKVLHKYLRVVPENCWYLWFTSINSSLSSSTPEHLSYHWLNAYSLSLLFVFGCFFVFFASHYLCACLPLGFLDLAARQARMAKTLPGPLTQATWWCYIACVAA